MNRSNAVAVTSFAIVFAAGFFVGRLRWVAPQQQADGSGSWLAAQLDLTDQQREQVKRIWADQLRSAPDPAEEFDRAEATRDAAVRALLSDPQQKTAYDAIAAKHHDRIEALRAEYDRSLADAEEKTRAVLNPSQRDKFEQIIQQHTRLRPRPEVVPIVSKERAPSTQPIQPKGATISP